MIVFNENFDNSLTVCMSLSVYVCGWVMVGQGFVVSDSSVSFIFLDNVFISLSDSPDTVISLRG